MKIICDRIATLAKSYFMEEQDAFEGKLFRKLFDAAPDPILIVGDDGEILLANAEAANKFGYAVNDLLGNKIEILLPDRFRSQHVEKRGGYIASPTTRPMGAGLSLFAQHRDGRQFPVEISLSPLIVGQRKATISIIRDITDRKVSEIKLQKQAAELARSNRELEEFAYIASHDLQEPLRSVAGACQLLERRSKDKLDSVSLELIGFAVNGAKRMEELIKDLLSYSRVSTKQAEPKTTDLNQVLAKVIANLSALIGEANATVTNDSLPNIAVDEWQFTQLFQNLIANAVKFRSPDGPTVHIGFREDEENYVFYVSDNGIGIEAKYFERIFAVFKRLHTREEYPGTGIGLASCKKIVERHGGSIWLTSQVGKGTTFFFSIPKKKSG